MNNAQEKEGILVEKGMIKVDSQHMERRVDSELKKIVDEQMRPFELYGNEEKRNFLLGTLGSTVLSPICAWALFGTIGSMPEEANALLCIISGVPTGCCFFTALGGFFGSLDAISKQGRAEKFFSKIANRLKAGVSTGVIDVSELSGKFKARVAFRKLSPNRLKEILSIRDKRINHEKYARKEESKLAAQEKEELIRIAKRKSRLEEKKKKRLIRIAKASNF